MTNATASTSPITSDAKLYVCINCGKKVKELFKSYSSSITKISSCDKCFRTADKYVEFETIIIIIDVALLSQHAYRHILFNTNFKIHWKLAIVLLLIESYSKWEDRKAYQKYGDAPDLTEKSFYLSCLKVFLANIILFLCIYVLSKIIHRLNNKNQIVCDKNAHLYLWKGITLASLGKFLLLPIVIWKDNSTETGIIIHLALVMGYFFVSLTHIYAVLHNASRQLAIGVIALAMLCEFYFTEIINDFIQPLLQ